MTKRAKKPRPDLLRIANTLRGLSMHAKVIAGKHGVVEFSGPIDAIDEIVAEIDAWEETVASVS